LVVDDITVGLLLLLLLLFLLGFGCCLERFEDVYWEGESCPPFLLILPLCQSVPQLRHGLGKV
jgi:hypothetical protein